MKRFIILLLSIVALLCSCDTRDGLWGTYKTETADGNYKSVEFAYSKVFYTLDALKAAEEDDTDDESEAVIEGWYDITGDEVKCTFRHTEDGKSSKHEYTFVMDGDTLTLVGYTVDGEKADFKEEKYTK